MRPHATSRRQRMAPGKKLGSFCFPPPDFIICRGFWKGFPVDFQQCCISPKSCCNEGCCIYLLYAIEIEIHIFAIQYLKSKHYSPQQRKSFFFVPVHNIFRVNCCTYKSNWIMISHSHKFGFYKMFQVLRDFLIFTMFIFQPNPTFFQNLKGNFHIVHLLQSANCRDS